MGIILNLNLFVFGRCTDAWPSQPIGIPRLIAPLASHQLVTYALLVMAKDKSQR